MDDIYPILECLDRPGKKVLATIIDVNGSAYKKEGSTMLFLEDGTKIGMLSPGCLEEDLAFKAVEVWEHGKATTIQYDMREETDLDWGQGAGCNGSIKILLEPIDEQLATDLLKLKRLLSSNIPVLGWKKQGEYLFLPIKGSPFGKWIGEIPGCFSRVKSGMMRGDLIYQHLFYPKPRLILFGAGPDTRPIVSFAAKTGFSVVVCDWREDFCKGRYFPEADWLIVGFPNEIINKITFTLYDFVLIASHHFQRDREILCHLPRELIRYVGVLGPSERTKRLIGTNETTLPIQSPVGLSIGAKGPEEIAISIIAQLIEEWRMEKQRN